jgi:hypothetical protein
MADFTEKTHNDYHCRSRQNGKKGRENNRTIPTYLLSHCRDPAYGHDTGRPNARRSDSDVTCHYSTRPTCPTSAPLIRILESRDALLETADKMIMILER